MRHSFRLVNLRGSGRVFGLIRKAFYDAAFPKPFIVKRRQAACGQAWFCAEGSLRRRFIKSIVACCAVHWLSSTTISSARFEQFRNLPNWLCSVRAESHRCLQFSLTIPAVWRIVGGGDGSQRNTGKFSRPMPVAGRFRRC